MMNGKETAARRGTELLDTKKSVGKRGISRSGAVSGVVHFSRQPAEGMNLPTALTGWVLRTALVLLCTWAFLLFWGDGAGILMLEGRIQDQVLVSRGSLFLAAAAGTVIGSLLLYSRWTALAALLLSGGGAAILAARLGTALPRFAADAARCFANTVLTNLSDAGYTVMAGYVRGASYGWNEARLLTAVYCAVGAALGLIFSLLLLRGVRPVGVGILSALWLIPVFTYNVTKSNQGVLLVIASLTGVVALWLYDRHFGVPSEKRLASRQRRRTKREARKNARMTAAAQKKALRLAASDAMIAAYDAGGDRRGAAAAKKDVYRREKQRIAEEKTAAVSRRSPEQEKLPPEERRRIRREKREIARAERRRKRYNHAAGGFAGIGAALVALAALAIPGSAIDGNFPVIDMLDQKIRVARLYATAYLMGDDIDLNSLSLYGGVAELNPRNVSFDSPRFTGERIFSVTSGYNAPVYLRSWIGTEYDLETDTWISADSHEVTEYRNTFGTSFTSDTVGFNFNKYVYPQTAELEKPDVYRGYSGYGFVLTQVNVRREGGTGRIMFVPAHLHTDMGIMEYESIEPNRYKVTSYYDGVYSSRFFAIPGRSYSAYAFVTTMKSDDLGTVYEAQSEYFLRSLYWADLVDAAEAAHEQGVGVLVPGEGLVIPTLVLEEAYQALNTAYEAEMIALGATWRGDSILEQYVNMSREERAAYRFAYTLEEEYRAYAYQTYKGSFGSEPVAKLAQQLLADAGWHYDSASSGKVTDGEGNAVPQHDLVKMVLDYLGGEDFTYSLTPAAPEGTYASNLEAFLFGSREGYCVHFATAAAAILREYGLAVRYNEGYVASDFRERRGALYGRYYTSVYDYNAHAWIEVYYPLMGWVQYEATPAYMSAMYNASEGYSTSAALPPAEEIEEEEPEEEIELIIGEEERDWTPLITALILLLIAAGIAVTVCLLVRRGRKFAARRQAMLNDARDRDAYYSGSRDNRALTRQLNDMVYGVFTALGFPPRNGELSGAYAARITEEYGELSRYGIGDVLGLMGKEEFGRGLSYEELVTLAEYLEEMSREVYAGLSLPRRFWMRCIRCAV